MLTVSTMLLGSLQRITEAVYAIYTIETRAQRWSHRDKTGVQRDHNAIFRNEQRVSEAVSGHGLFDQFVRGKTALKITNGQRKCVSLHSLWISLSRLRVVFLSSLSQQITRTSMRHAAAGRGSTSAKATKTGVVSYAVIC